MKIHNIRSPLSGWVGGKYQLSKTIIPLIPKHTCYIEPFCGAAWILFRKPQSKCEVINDINRDVVTLYRVIQHHKDELLRQIQWTIFARDEFKRLLNVDPDTLTDIQRAVRFYYLQKSAFGGKIAGAVFGVSATDKPKLNLIRVEKDLEIAHQRLMRVTVENMGYSDLIKRYDRKGSFFYVDPPYWGCEDYYGKQIFSPEDFQKLSDQLASIKGKFLLSINDTSEIRATFDRFDIGMADTTYSLSSKANKRVSELLIKNY